MNQPSQRRAAGWAASFPEWLVLFALLAAAIPPVLLRRQSLTVVPFLNLLDASWALDICYKAANGVWLGRDVVFTYGPLYQWLSSIPSRWIGISTGTVLATASMLPTLASVLAVFVATRLLLPAVSSWRRALFLVVVLWSPPGLRLALCVFAFAVFVRLTDAVATHRLGAVLSALVAAIICLVCFLVSADAGLYAAAALVLSVAATAIVKWRTPRAISGLGAFSVAAAVWLAVSVVATNAVMLSPLNFFYWKSSLTLSTSYRWFEAKVHNAALHLADPGDCGSGDGGVRGCLVAPAAGRRSLDAAAGVPAVGILPGRFHDAERPGTVRCHTRGEWRLSHDFSQRRHSDRRAD